MDIAFSKSSHHTQSSVLTIPPLLARIPLQVAAPYAAGASHTLHHTVLILQQLRSASRLGRARLMAREFAGDVYSLWRYGAPFPTFLKLISTLLLCLLVFMPLLYPFFVLAVTYFTYESLYLSWWLDQPWRFHPLHIARRMTAAAIRPYNVQDMWKVREILTRGILLAHSFATSIDYLCVMQGLLDET